MESNKVKLPKEICDILDRYKGGYVSGSNWMVLAEIFRSEEPNRKMSQDEYLLISFAKESEQNFEKLLQAIVNGYEVEQTPEDIVKQLYNLPPFTHNIGAYRNGIEDTLNALNIKIKGVNDHET